MRHLLLAFLICLSSASSLPHTVKAETVENTRLVILGTAAGRSSWRGSLQGGFSAAVQVGQSVYVVDFGRGWADRYHQAGLGPQPDARNAGGFEYLKAGFITHMHADHIVDLPQLMLMGFNDGVRKPIAIIGPGRNETGAREPKNKRAGALVNPANPYPGTVDMVNGLIDSFAHNFNDALSDVGIPSPKLFYKPRDIEIPKVAKANGQNVAPPMRPFEVYKDDKVRVTAILVDHAPIFPSFAYRFDTSAGSIVFSGDTNRNQNLIRLARGADILVHEVIDGGWVNKLMPPNPSPLQKYQVRHLIESHTLLDEVGLVAAEAEVGKLVLAHVAPFDLSAERVVDQAKGFDNIVLAEPLMSFTLD